MPFQDPEAVVGAGRLLAQGGVDGEAHAILRLASGVIATVACTVVRPLDNAATITGSGGSIHLDDPWVPDRSAPPSDATLRLRRGGAEPLEEIRRPEQFFEFEARMATEAVARGALEAPHPAASHADSLGNARTFDRWREALAWALQQPFPSLAPIGPRSAGDLSSTLSGLGIEPSQGERAWLDLRERTP